MTTVSLSFTVSLAVTADDVRDACAVRADAYAHHVPCLHDALTRPDVQDGQRGTAIVLCRDKDTGRAIGTARIQRNAAAPLRLESTAVLPPWLAEQPRAEVSRLAVLPGAAPLTRLALMKAGYLYCLASQVRWMVIGARSDALVRIYQGLGFRDVPGPDGSVLRGQADNVPLRILAFDIATAERTWLASGHGLYSFMFETYHRDLQLFPEDRVPCRVGEVRQAA